MSSGQFMRLRLDSDLLGVHWKIAKLKNDPFEKISARSVIFFTRANTKHPEWDTFYCPSIYQAEK